MRRKCTFLSYLDTLVQFFRCRLLILKDCCSNLVNHLDPCVLVGSESVWIHVFWSDPIPFGSMCFGRIRIRLDPCVFVDPNPFGSMRFGRIRIRFGRIWIRLDPFILVGSESVWIHEICWIRICLDSCVLVKSEIRLDPCVLVWWWVWIHVLWSNPYPVFEKKPRWSGSIQPGFETLLSQESQY